MIDVKSVSNHVWVDSWHILMQPRKNINILLQKSFEAFQNGLLKQSTNLCSLSGIQGMYLN